MKVKDATVGVHTMHNTVSETSLFQPHLGQTKVAVLVRWLDFRVTLLMYKRMDQSFGA